MHNVGILLYDDTEVLDFAGPYEVFFAALQASEMPLLRIFTVSQDGGLVKTTGGMRIASDYSFDDCPELDILVIPGGVGSRIEYQNPAMLEFVGSMTERTQIVFSVCSGTRILAALGLLDGLPCTSHHSMIATLTDIAPAVIIDTESRFVDNGHIMTAGGVSAGIDLALHIVERLYGSEIRRKAVDYMEYGDWR